MRKNNGGLLILCAAVTAAAIVSCGQKAESEPLPEPLIDGYTNGAGDAVLPAEGYDLSNDTVGPENPPEQQIPDEQQRGRRQRQQESSYEQQEEPAETQPEEQEAVDEEPIDEEPPEEATEQVFNVWKFAFDPMPEGFELESQSERNGLYVESYKETDGLFSFHVTYYSIKLPITSALARPREYYDYEAVTVNGTAADLYTEKGTTLSNLKWIDGETGTHIAIFSNLPKEEALKIAESFHPVETVEITLPR